MVVDSTIQPYKVWFVEPNLAVLLVLGMLVKCRANWWKVGSVISLQERLLYLVVYSKYG